MHSTAIEMTPQQRRYLANDLAQAALDWFREGAYRLSFSDNDRIELARTLALLLAQKGV